MTCTRAPTRSTQGCGWRAQWERQGDARFRQLACDLLRFGARVYAIYQPQYLGEFISENVDPALSSHDYVSSDEIRSAVDEARRLAGPRSGD